MECYHSLMHPDVAAVITELDSHRAKFEAPCRSLSEAAARRAAMNLT